MISFSRTSSTLFLLATVALLGVGCSKGDIRDAALVPSSNTTPSTATAPLAQSTAQQATNTEPVDGGTITTSSALDTTGWQTYTNKTLKFSFMYPLRGSFAPKFDITLLPLNTPNIENDCFKAPAFPDTKQARVVINGTPFCATSYSEGAAGTIYNDQQWVTKNGKWYAVIHFTKSYPNNPERPFDVAGYQRQLESILSTFQYLSAS